MHGGITFEGASVVFISSIDCNGILVFNDLAIIVLANFNINNSWAFNCGVNELFMNHFNCIRHLTSDINSFLNYLFNNFGSSSDNFDWFLNDLLNLNLLVVFYWNFDNLLDDLFDRDIAVLNSLVGNLNLLLHDSFGLNLSFDVLDDFLGDFNDTLNWFLNFNDDFNLFNWNIYGCLVVSSDFSFTHVSITLANILLSNPRANVRCWCRDSLSYR